MSPFETIVWTVTSLRTRSSRLLTSLPHHRQLLEIMQRWIEGHICRLSAQSTRGCWYSNWCDIILDSFPANWHYTSALNKTLLHAYKYTIHCQQRFPLCVKTTNHSNRGDSRHTVLIDPYTSYIARIHMYEEYRHFLEEVDPDGSTYRSTAS